MSVLIECLVSKNDGGLYRTNLVDKRRKYKIKYITLHLAMLTLIGIAFIYGSPVGGFSLAVLYLAVLLSAAA